jgi:hemolysin activation/secretion protein
MYYAHRSHATCTKRKNRPKLGDGLSASFLISNSLSTMRLLPVAVAVVALWTTVHAVAADVADPLNKREPARPGYLPTTPAESFSLPPIVRKPQPPDSTDQGKQFVQRIIFHGNTAISTSELDIVAAPYRGRLVSAAEVEELRQALTRHYIERGYINSGALLEPDAPDWTIAFRIVEGKISSVRLRGMDNLNDAYVADRLLRADDGAANIDVLRERFQMLLSDPLIGRMNARLLPGESPGEAILDIDVVRNRPYQVTAFFNNYHSPAIGSQFVGIAASVANLTGRGDQLDVSYQDSTESPSGAWGSVAWNVPLNFSGAGFNVQAQHIRSAVVEYPLNNLNIRSTLDILDVGLSELILESLRQRIAIGINESYRRNGTTLLGEPFSFVPSEPSGTTEAWTTRVWQDYAYRLENQVLALRSTFSFVHDNLRDVEGLPPTPRPDTNYWYWLGQAQYARQVIDNGTQIVLRGSLQSTSYRLLPLDLIPIGGVYTVRGYRENQIVRDTGGVFNTEFHYPALQEARDGVGVWLIPFFDWGKGRNQGEPGTILSSYGLAARVNWKGVQLDVSKAWRLIHPAILNSLHGTAQDRGVNFQLTYTFFGV